MTSTLTILLSHQKPEQLRPVIDCWIRTIGAESLVLAYGGPAELFPKIEFPNKLFVDDDLLRVPDQQRQYQSWRGVLRAGLTWLADRPQHTHVHLTEYDQIPLVADLRERLLATAQSEAADVLGHHLQRIDGTSNAHYLFHSHEDRFHRHFDQISRRADTRTILSMLPTGSFWTREAFEAVASREEAVPVYVELYLPTLAHHLGYRVRDLAAQNRFVSVLGDRGDEIADAGALGAWTLHPVKDLSRTPLSIAS